MRRLVNVAMPPTAATLVVPWSVEPTAPVPGLIPTVTVAVLLVSRLPSASVMWNTGWPVQLEPTAIVPLGCVTARTLGAIVESTAGMFVEVSEPVPSWPSVLSPQHFTTPVWIAHMCPTPPSRAVTPLVRPVTATGAVLEALALPLPNWPNSLLPQHITSPPVRSAHVECPAAAIATTPVRPVTVTGVLLLVVVPLPSWPLLLRPQHCTVPPPSIAHAWDAPAEIIDTPVPRPVTSRGTLLKTPTPAASVESPSEPCSLSPQHFTPPPVVRAQTNVPPAATSATPLVRPVTFCGSTLFVAFVPLPIVPCVPVPQHFAPPPVVTAHANLPPALIEATPLDSVETGFGVVQTNGEATPLPSAPEEPQLLPQHSAAPAPVTPQENVPPALIDSVPEPKPETPTAVRFAT